MFVQRIGFNVVLYEHKTNTILKHFPTGEISTRRGLIRTIHALCAEAWITPKHIQEIIDIAHSLVGKNL